MLGKTLVYGTVAAVLIGSAAAVYAQMQGTPPEAARPIAGSPPADAGENGYLRPSADGGARTAQDGKSFGPRRESGERNGRGDDEDDD